MGPGADWKERREEMGKTLDEASLEVRISQKYLRGIEEGNYSRWPPKVFSTGFIRAYANFLSVNPDPVLSDYFSFLEARSVEEPPLHTRPEWLERERQRGSRRTVYTIATVAVLAIGVCLAWYARHTALRPLPATEIREMTRPPSPAVPAPEEDPARPPDDAVEGGEKAAEAPPETEPKTVTAVGGSGPVSAPYQLFLEASELTWIMYGRDGAEPVDVMLYPGDRLSIQAQKKVFLKIGNAGGVVGTLNGNLLPPFGEKGQVKEITLGE
ncbi:MAG: RodZ domain-containing protein [Candidatus Deferrimicrobiaceae bacterium]